MVQIELFNCLLRIIIIIIIIIIINSSSGNNLEVYSYGQIIHTT